MTSPYIRRLRLGAELRELRLARGLTTEALGQAIHQNRMKITRLEHGQAKINLIDVLNLLDHFEVEDPLRSQIIQFARDGASWGWWDDYTDPMSARQRRSFADIESGIASVRQYEPSMMPGLLQTGAYTDDLVQFSAAELSDIPGAEFVSEVRAKRQAAFFRPDGPTFEAVLHEAALRMFLVRPETMQAQIAHLIHLVQSGRVDLRIIRLETRQVTMLPLRAPLFLYTFPDPLDPPMAIETSTSADQAHTERATVDRYVRRYDAMRQLSLTVEESTELLATLGDEVGAMRGPHL